MQAGHGFFEGFLARLVFEIFRFFAPALSDALRQVLMAIKPAAKPRVARKGWHIFLSAV